MTAFIAMSYQHGVDMGLESQMGMSFSMRSIHTTITFEQNGKVVLSEYHAGAITQLGMNLTLAKLTGFGTSAYNLTTYNLNTTIVGIGYNTTALDNTLTGIPNEWNCTSATVHAATYNSCNFTAVFHPNTGPFTAGCIGLKYEQYNNATMWGYDSFTQVTGIDTTFTITIEIKVTVS